MPFKLILLICVCTLLVAHGFVSSPNAGSCRILVGLESKAEADDGDRFTAGEVDSMNNLIVSLSKERDDDTRRSKLKGILDEELSKQEPHSIDFTTLFQRSLNEVGERVQNSAREAAAARVQEGSNEEPEEQSVKTDEELELWALIDMMVQSKTQFKKAEGSLGSTGEFR